MKTGFLEPGIHLIRHPIPDIGARGEQSRNLDRGEFRSGVDKQSYCRAGVPDERFPKPFVRYQPSNEQLDTPLCHLVSRLPGKDHRKPGARRD